MEKVSPLRADSCWPITHQVPLLGEQGVAHVDLDVVEIPVATLLAVKAFLIGDILHLRSTRGGKIRGQGHR